MGTEALLGVALVLAIVGGLLALVAWRRELSRTIAEAQRREERESALRREVELREEDLRERDAEVDAERRQAERGRAIAARERELNRELRARIAEMQARMGALGQWHDVPSLILQTAVELTDAEKGVLLAHDDGGDLSVAAHSGFDDDPGLDQVAERFAGEALARDETVRDDDLLAVPIYVRDEFSGVIVCVNEEGEFHALEDEVLLALGDHAGAILQNHRLHGELRGSYLATVTLLAEAIQAKDPFLRGHSEEVSAYVSAVAARLEMDKGQRERLVFGSLLHDVGKIGISERILHKPGKLTPEEFAVVQLHPRIGYRLIEQVPALRPMAQAILHHHERYDGGGYPTGLRGEQIPLEARIVAVADAFSA
ncbi:MAG: HD domain-containing protein, partial [Actinomycetota bacterium]|nr:HD domain-containing protein [Actinomycetota bacterium]